MIPPALLALTAGVALQSAQPAAAQFVTRQGADFALDGKPFRYGGTNCYYLHYKDPFMIDDALQRAADNNFTLLRMWTFLDADTCEESPGWDGVMYQCWSKTRSKVLINETNLERLDYVIAKAASLGIRLVLTLTNNWGDFGGMDQYVRWRTYQDPSFTPYHDSFYTDDVIRGWYERWAKVLINRYNSMRHMTYRDDPTIFAWQLANEPRCGTANGFNTSSACVGRPGEGNTSALVPWVADMAAYIKSLDPNHMVSVGDEGFYCNATSAAEGSGCTPGTWWCDCSTGVDSLAFMSTPDVDYGTAHLYPEDWGTSSVALTWGQQWIVNHTQQAHALKNATSGALIGKPFVVEEMGYHNVTAGAQRQMYSAWTSAALSAGMYGWHFWMLAGLSQPGSDPADWYPGDGLNIYCAHDGDPAVPAGHDAQSCALLRVAAQAMMAAAAESTQSSIYAEDTLVN